MSTCGIIFIKCNRKVKLAQYCQFDMYYSGHGLKLASMLNHMYTDKLYDYFKEKVRSLKFVTEEYLQNTYDNAMIPTQFMRDTASNIIPLIIKGITEVFDSSNHINGFWLEYAYVIDLDSNKLHIYTKHINTGDLLYINYSTASQLKYHTSFKINSKLFNKFTKFAEEFEKSNE